MTSVTIGITCATAALALMMESAGKYFSVYYCGTAVRLQQAGEDLRAYYNRGRLLQRWEDCIKRDVRKAGRLTSGGRRLLIGRSGKR